MHKSEKERVVAELAERLRTSETLIVADYRGLTNAEIDGLRSKLLEHGARFAVVKNTLTRRAAEAAGADALLALLEGPSAIAFVESGGDPVAVAKALADAATSTKVLAIRGGVLEGKSLTAAEVESLAKLPPADVIRHSSWGRSSRRSRPSSRSVGTAARSRRADRRPDRAAEGAGRHVRGRCCPGRRGRRAGRGCSGRRGGGRVAEAEAEERRAAEAEGRAPKQPPRDRG